MTFDPRGALERRENRKIQWINMSGQSVPAPVYQEIPTKENMHSYPPATDCTFRDPDRFVAGNVHHNADIWEKVCSKDEAGQMVLSWVKDKVDLHDFIVHYEGEFQGAVYDHSFPPPKKFKNSKNCKDFVQFIAATLEERITNGSVEVLGRVGECSPPHIVAPITIEESKPRLCLNLQYLNCWMGDTPFSLDTLVDVPRIVDKDAYLTSLDDKSSYDHVSITEGSRNLVGLAFQGWFMVLTTIPFGWKNSAYVYHTLNMQPMSYLRRLSIVGFGYIDDRLFEKARGAKDLEEIEKSSLAIAVACQLLVQLGFFLGIKKSVLVPTQVIRFLGLLTDTVRQTFVVPGDKKQKFADLRELILREDEASVKTLQRLQGKCVSFLLAVPAAKLYIREMASAIASATSPQGLVEISGPLREEVEHWRFLDDWEGYVPWRDERHVSINISTDSSSYKWGGVVDLQGSKQSVGDYWPIEDRGTPIMVLEAKALLRVLESFASHLRDARCDTLVDNLALMYAWRNEGCRSPELNAVLKDLFMFCLGHNVLLKLDYVPTDKNEADAPSREIRKSDSCLTNKSWNLVQKAFGGPQGHNVDLMALDSNAMKSREGEPLPHFTPYPTPGSAGVNVFSQTLEKHLNYYVFPPFCLLLVVLRYIEVQGVSATLIVPGLDQTPSWFPKLLGLCVDARLIGRVGQKDVLLYPSRKGFREDRAGLQQNLWAARISHEELQGGLTFSSIMFRCNPAIGQAMPLDIVVASDSMLRFLLLTEFGKDPLAHIFASSGARWSGVVQQAVRLAEEVVPSVLVIHAGINDLLRRDENEYMLMKRFMETVDVLPEKLRNIHRNTKVVLSAIVQTNKDWVNARVAFANSALEELAARHGWFFLDNSYLRSSDLKGGLHLRCTGEQKYLKALCRRLEEILLA